MPVLATHKQLAQRNLTTTSDSIIYQPPIPGLSTGSNNGVMTTFVKTLIVCNLTGSSATYSIWVNQNGSVSGDQFALIKNMTIAANASDQRIYPADSGIILIGPNATLIAKCSVANAINVTLYGLEVLQT